MDAKLNDPFAQSRYGSGRPLDEQKNVGIMQRMPLINDGLGYRDMPVSHSSGPPMASASSGLTSGGDFGGLMPPNQVQSSPTANASQWAMYPPVPPYGSEHLRTGRFYLMRSTSPDIDAASYIEQATFRVGFPSCPCAICFDIFLIFYAFLSLSKRKFKLVFLQRLLIAVSSTLSYSYFTMCDRAKFPMHFF